MPKEIKRKFLVDKTKLPPLEEGTYIKQGYILNSSEKVVRVRTRDFGGIHQWGGFLTVKGKNEGMTRPEYEYDIPYEEAKEMLGSLCGRILEKTRHDLEYEGYNWEIDFFEGQTLVLAEVELKSEDEEVPIPEWAVKEVTGDPRYYNSNIIYYNSNIINEV